MAALSYICPVCGYDQLIRPPYSQYGMPVETGSYGEPLELGDPSDEICPSCGIHFGFHDVLANIPAVLRVEARQTFYQAWRERWVASGMKFWSREWRRPPSEWNPMEQLRRVDSKRQ